MKALVIIDMQNDFIDGALGSADALTIVPNVAKKAEKYRAAGDLVLFTRDTHGENYLTTQEGKNLPIPHCIEGSRGWEISDQLCTEGAPIINKITFGSRELPEVLSDELKKQNLPSFDSIELIGLCTDICVISNAMLLKAFFPETPILVDSGCCAGVTPESHRNAIKAMEACQIQIL